MKDIGYNEIGRHIKEHIIFSDRILQLQLENDNYDFEHSRELMACLGYRLHNHVIIEDKQYSI